MKTVTKESLEMSCGEVLRDAPALLQGITDPGQRNDRLLRDLFERLCKQLNLDPNEQARGLGNSPGFVLMQTIEEHMDPEFAYSNVLDQQLLIKAKNL